MIDKLIKYLKDFATTPNYSKGYYDVDTESIIRPGDFAGDQKPWRRE